MDSELRERAKRWLWGPGGDIAEFCAEGHDVIEGLLKEIDRLEGERDDAIGLVHQVWAAAIALNCDAAIVADKTYTSEFVRSNILGHMRKWKTKIDRLERELANAVGPHHD